jgi:AmiR/NasT family two-component response regulator
MPPDGTRASAEPHELKVLVADETERHLEPLQRAVELLGHEVVCHALEAAQVSSATHEHRPDIAIVVFHEDTAHALDLIAEIVHESACPVMVVMEDADREFVAAAAERGVFAHLDSTDENELQGAIDVAMQRYRQFRRLQEAFERRARIERAKGLLMERHGIGERDAFEHLRGEARSSRRRLIDVVDELLSS